MAGLGGMTFKSHRLGYASPEPRKMDMKSNAIERKVLIGCTPYKTPPNNLDFYSLLFPLVNRSSRTLGKIKTRHIVLF